MHHVIDFYKNFSSDFEELSDDPPKLLPKSEALERILVRILFKDLYPHYNL